MSQMEIRIAGFGGQGVILCGMILGRAATIFADKFATLTQSFGPEARGGACAVQVILADQPVLYPYVTSRTFSPSCLRRRRANSFRSFNRRHADRGGRSGNVETGTGGSRAEEGSRDAPGEEIGPKIVQNMVMVGFITAVTGLLPVDAVRQSIRRSVPEGTETINLMAFERGYRYGKENNKAD
jgi:2-oxoglutarate ferredoxin oxidoreductase subunit gamma